MADSPIEVDAIPQDWASDPLAKFLEDAHHNTIVTFSKHRSEYNVLAAIDRLYCEMIENLNQSPEIVPRFLLVRSHSSFRGGVRLCLSGQVAEAYCVPRGCLESALYGLYTAGDFDCQEIWVQRHDDEASQRRVRREFTIGNVLNKLQAVDA